MIAHMFAFRSAYHVFYSSQRLFFAELLEIDLDIFNKTG